MNATKRWCVFVVMLFVMASCASNPTDQWFQQRAVLTGVTELVGVAHDSGVIDDEQLVYEIDPLIVGARSYLEQAFEYLPNGGPTFDMLMNALDVALLSLQPYYMEGGE